MKTTQGRRLIAALKRRPMTYGAMQALGISTSPQKRVAETLREDEQIVKAKGADGLVRWRVVAATKWTK
jgi:hypothetical protein